MSDSKFYLINKDGDFSELDSLEKALTKLKDGGFIWLSYFRPQKEELNKLIGPLGLHPLSIEDCLDEEQIPKLDNFPNHTHILFNTFDYTGEKLSISEINFFLGENFIVSVSRNDKDEPLVLKNIEDLIRHDLENSIKGPAFIMHMILDYIVDKKFLAIEAIEDEIVKAEDAMLDNLADFNPGQLQRIRRDLLALRKSLFHEREILGKISRKDIRFIPDSAIFHYSDIYDHLTKFFELTEINREMVTSLTQMNLSLLNNKMAKSANQTNMSVKRLTSITTVFMPLTLLAGVGGMSEWTMMTGQENWKIAYPAFISGMIVIALVNHFLLKWLGRKDNMIDGE